MSALISISTKDAFYIGTDTLSYTGYGDNLKPVGMSQKIELYIGFKCCIVAMGYNNLKKDIHAFITGHHIGTDVSELVEGIKNHFVKYINYDRYPVIDFMKPEVIGDLHVFGFSDLLKRLVRYQIFINRDEITVQQYPEETNALFMHPAIEINTHVKAMLSNQELGYDKLLIELMKIQYADTAKAVGVGGEMIFTIISSNPEFGVAFSKPYQFDDYENIVDIVYTPLKNQIK